jgi:predicted phage terminase large subunit-like protein
MARAEQARRSLHEFVRQAWHVLEPAEPFVDNWHIGAICEHLEAASHKQLRRLIINIAPRHTKSLLVSVCWNAWHWATSPEARFFYTTYRSDLSLRDANNCRTLVKSAWYQRNWGSKFKIASDQDAKYRYETDKRGYRFSTSVEGGMTGEGGDILVLDDPHNATEAESEVERQNVKDFVDRAWSSRVNNPKTSVKVVVMQRLHEDDVTAHLLKKDTELGWERLILPTEHRPTTRVWFNGKRDPRTADSELLWPARFGPKEVADAKGDLGDYGFAAQHQQDPSARAAGMFKVAMLRQRMTRAFDPGCGYVEDRGWDLAATTKKDSKRTAGVRMAKDALGRYWVRHVVLGKWSPDDRNAEMLARTKADGFTCRVRVEHEGGSSGEDQAVSIARLLRTFAVEFIKVTGDKASRADAFAAQCNAGNVILVDDGTWDTEAYLSELSGFPEGAFKDQVDASSLAFNDLALAEVVEGQADGSEVRPPVPQEDPHWVSQLPGDKDWMRRMQS